MVQNKCFITFPSSYHVLQAEKYFKAHDLIFSIVPIPREITSSCGMAVMCECHDQNKFASILKSEKLEFEDFYQIKTKNPQSLWNQLMR